MSWFRAGPEQPEIQLAIDPYHHRRSHTHVESWAEANPGNALKMITGLAIRAATRNLRRKQTAKEDTPAKSEARQSRKIWAKREPPHTPPRGNIWRCNHTPSLGKNRRTRNLANGALAM